MFKGKHIYYFINIWDSSEKKIKKFPVLVKLTV